MRDFEELEGLTDQQVDDPSLLDENEDDDPTFRPAVAANLQSAEIYIEVRQFPHTRIFSRKCEFIPQRCRWSTEG